jgi:hypothetical protein
MDERQTADDDGDVIIWGAKNIASLINTTTKRAFNLLERRELPAEKVGGRWCTTRRHLRNHFELLLGDSSPGGAGTGTLKHLLRNEGLSSSATKTNISRSSLRKVGNSRRDGRAAAANPNLETNLHLPRGKLTGAPGGSRLGEDAT